MTIGVSRLLLCPIGGIALGFWKGLLWVQFGTMLGFYGTFLFVRWSGRDIILRTWPRLSRYAWVSRRKGIVIVLFIRQLPITDFYITFAAWVMPLSHVDFSLGTMIGILPAAVPATLLESGAVGFSSDESDAPRLQGGASRCLKLIYLIPAFSSPLTKRGFQGRLPVNYIRFWQSQSALHYGYW